MQAHLLAHCTKQFVPHRQAAVLAIVCPIFPLSLPFHGLSEADQEGSRDFRLPAMGHELSFGPFGKRNLFVRRGGCLDVAKPNLVGAHQLSPFQTHLNQLAHKFGSRHGDGTKSIVLIRNLLFQRLGSLLISPQYPRRRIELLWSTTALRSGFHNLKSAIVSHMLRASAWQVVDDCKTRLKMLCKNAVLPASNEYYASLLEELMVKYASPDCLPGMGLKHSYLCVLRRSTGFSQAYRKR